MVDYQAEGPVRYRKICCSSNKSVVSIVHIPHALVTKMTGMPLPPLCPKPRWHHSVSETLNNYPIGPRSRMQKSSARPKLIFSCHAWEKCQRQRRNKVPSRSGKEKVAGKGNAMVNSKGPHTETLIMYAWKFNQTR